jgi:hypothetical protein
VERKEKKLQVAFKPDGIISFFPFWWQVFHGFQKKKS